MDTVLQTALLLLILLQVKHVFADFFLQTPRMLVNRDVYIHFGRAEHAGLHAIFSLIALVAVGAPIWFSVILCVLEWTLHYHIDWIKGMYSNTKQHLPTDAGFWRAFGLDQLMHQLTYVAMIWAWASFAI